jgi:hypothetical protein
MIGYLSIIIGQFKKLLDLLKGGVGVDPIVLKSIADNLQRLADNSDKLVALNLDMAKDLDTMANAAPPPDHTPVGIEVIEGPETPRTT